MSAGNVVEILVKSTNDTAAGFDEAKAGATETAGAMDEYAAASQRAEEAQTELAEKQARLTELQQEGKASEAEMAEAQDEYAAALDRSTEASLRSMDAQIKLGRAELEAAGNAKESGDASEASGAKAEESGGLMAGMGSKAKLAFLGVAVGAGLAVKGAADFQQQTVKLVTSAGESAKNLGLVQRGILSLSASTNTSSQQLSSGMYMVESAGFHGAAGLTVLKAAAQGAAAEGADLGDVANAVTSGLNSYGMKASQATSFTNQMVTAVGRGKMTMQDLSSSLSAVLPIAASAHISFAQVGGGIATMTAQGMSARQASQDLAFSIRSLLHPSSTASQEMRAMGVNALDVSKNLGKVGLTGTMQELSDAVLRNTKGGTAFLGYMKSMTPAAQGLARQILAGTITTKELRTAVYNLNPQQAKLIGLFDTAATSATGLKQTYAGAMSAMTGGATGLNTSLMLTGTHAKAFAGNVRAIAASATHAGSNVKGWSDIQHEANFQIGSAGKAIVAMGDSLGLALLPSVTAILRPLTHFLGLVASNKAASVTLALVVGGVLAGALGGKLAGAFKDVKAGIEGFGSGLAWVAGKLGLTTAATGAQEAATEGATEAQDGLNLSMLANPITLIVVAIAALVVAFVELWKHCAAFRDFWKDTWRDIKGAFDAVFGWIKSHWQLILAILTGPIGLAVLFIKDHWKQILHDAQAAWDEVSHAVEHGWDDIRHLVAAGIGDIEHLAESFWNREVSGWERIFSDIVHLAEQFWDREISGFERIFTGIGHLAETFWDDEVRGWENVGERIVSTVENLGSRLFSAGAHIISMLAHGIESAIGDVTGAIGHVASEIISHLPFSPAKKGPLSGRGDPKLAGARISAYLAQGMDEGRGMVSAAAARMAGAAGVRPGGAGLAGAGGYGPGVLRVELEWAGSGGSNQQFLTWLRNNIRTHGGLQKVLGP